MLPDFSGISLVTLIFLYGFTVVFVGLTCLLGELLVARPGRRETSNSLGELLSLWLKERV
jgi:hypothetical protein